MKFKLKKKLTRFIFMTPRNYSELYEMRIYIIEKNKTKLLNSY